MKLSVIFGVFGLSAGLIAACGSSSDNTGAGGPLPFGSGGGTAVGGIGSGTGGSGTGATGSGTGGTFGAGGTPAGLGGAAGLGVGTGGGTPGAGGFSFGPDGGRPPPGGCATNTDCNGRRGGPVCDVATGQCVGCLAAADCTIPGELCNVGAHRCVAGCSATGADGGGCTGRNPVCDAAKGYCVQCVSNANCTQSTTRHSCLVDTGRCVECLSDADCPGSTCDLQAHACN